MLCSCLVRSGGLFWLKPVVEIYGMLFVMYGSSVFSSVFAFTARSEMGLYNVYNLELI